MYLLGNSEFVVDFIFEARDFSTNPLVDKMRDKVDKKMKDDREAKRRNIEDIDGFIKEMVRVTQAGPGEQIIFPYYKWILIKYANTPASDFSLEDVGKVVDQLNTYDRLKRGRILSKDDQDINRVKNSRELYNLIKKYISDDSVGYERIAYLILQGDMKIYYEDSSIIVLDLQTQAGCETFKGQTNWCTTRGAWRTYLIKGPLYAILAKPDYKPLYQFQFAGYPQLKDTDDEDIDPKVIDKYRLRDVFKGSFLDPKAIEVQVKVLDQNIYYIKYIKEESYKLQIALIRKDVKHIEHISDPHPDVQLIAVQDSGYYLDQINKPTYPVMKAAVQDTGYAIQFIKNPDKELQMLAVQDTGSAILSIDNPSLEVKIAAAYEDPDVLEFLPSKDQKDPDIIAAAEKGKSEGRGGDGCPPDCP